MPRGGKIARIVRAAGSLFIVAEGSPLSIIQRLLRETRLQLLEHPRFYSGVDVWPLSCYGLTTVISSAVHVVAKHHENN